MLLPRSLTLFAICILLIFSLPSSQANLSTQWQDCGRSSAYKFKVSNATLEPESIYPGNEVRFTIITAGGAEEAVPAGKITMLVQLFGIPIYTEQDDLCSKTTCPIPKAADHVKIVYEESFPEYTPPGSYAVTLSGTSASGNDLFCVLINFEVKPSPPSHSSGDGLHPSIGAAAHRLYHGLFARDTRGTDRTKKRSRALLSV